MLEAWGYRLGVRDHVWIVEGSWDGGPWQPTVGVALTKEDARLVLTQWKGHNPDDRFRVVKYVRRLRAGR